MIGARHENDAYRLRKLPCRFGQNQTVIGLFFNGLDPARIDEALGVEITRAAIQAVLNDRHRKGYAIADRMMAKTPMTIPSRVRIDLRRLFLIASRAMKKASFSVLSEVLMYIDLLVSQGFDGI